MMRKAERRCTRSCARSQALLQPVAEGKPEAYGSGPAAAPPRGFLIEELRFLVLIGFGAFRLALDMLRTQSRPAPALRQRATGPQSKRQTQIKTLAAGHRPRHKSCRFDRTVRSCILVQERSPQQQPTAENVGHAFAQRRHAEGLPGSP